MTNEEILQKWKQGLSKDRLAILYKREYNRQIRISRASVRNRQKGKFISNFEALRQIEQVIYQAIQKESSSYSNKNSPKESE